MAMEMMQESVTETQVNEMLQLADLDKDGKINYEGKINYFKLCSFVCRRNPLILSFSHPNRIRTIASLIQKCCFFYYHSLLMHK